MATTNEKTVKVLLLKNAILQREGTNENYEEQSHEVIYHEGPVEGEAGTYEHRFLNKTIEVPEAVAERLIRIGAAQEPKRGRGSTTTEE